MGDKVYFLTVRESLDLELIPAPEGFTPEDIQPPSVDVGDVTPGTVTGSGFPWQTAGSVGAKFDVLPDSLKDAISWFWPRDLWEGAATITSCEAPNHSAATRDTRGQPTPRGVTQEYSVGSWQINLLAHTNVREEQARNDWWSTEYAYGLYRQNGDYSAWAYCAQAYGLPQHVV